MNKKITKHHLERQAVVYLRQSSMRQVRINTESTKRQYNLSKRAIQLGWPETQVVVVDEDLGKSGRFSEKRTGFQRIAEGVANGSIGAVFNLEVHDPLHRG